MATLTPHQVSLSFRKTRRHGRECALLAAEVARLGSGCEGLRGADALFTGLGLDDLVPLDLERLPHQLQVLGVVFDNKNQFIRHGAQVT